MEDFCSHVLLLLNKASDYWILISEHSHQYQLYISQYLFIMWTYFCWISRETNFRACWPSLEMTGDIGGTLALEFRVAFTSSFPFYLMRILCFVIVLLLFQIFKPLKSRDSALLINLWYVPAVFSRDLYYYFFNEECIIWSHFYLLGLTQGIFGWNW